MTCDLAHLFRRGPWINAEVLHSIWGILTEDAVIVVGQATNKGVDGEETTYLVLISLYAISPKSTTPHSFLVLSYWRHLS